MRPIILSLSCLDNLQLVWNSTKVIHNLVLRQKENCQVVEREGGLIPLIYLFAISDEKCNLYACESLFSIYQVKFFFLHFFLNKIFTFFFLNYFYIFFFFSHFKKKKNFAPFFQKHLPSARSFIDEVIPVRLNPIDLLLWQRVGRGKPNKVQTIVNLLVNGGFTEIQILWDLLQQFYLLHNRFLETSEIHIIKKKYVDLHQWMKIFSLYPSSFKSTVFLLLLMKNSKNKFFMIKPIFWNICKFTLYSATSEDWR